MNTMKPEVDISNGFAVMTILELTSAQQQILKLYYNSHMFLNIPKMFYMGVEDVRRSWEHF